MLLKIWFNKLVMSTQDNYTKIETVESSTMSQKSNASIISHNNNCSINDEFIEKINWSNDDWDKNKHQHDKYNYTIEEYMKTINIMNWSEPDWKKGICMWKKHYYSMDSIVKKMNYEGSIQKPNVLEMKIIIYHFQWIGPLRRLINYIFD